MLGVLDIVIVLASILFCLAIGIWSKRKSKENVENYLLADRKMSYIPTAFSVLATLVSANSMTSYSGETFKGGAQFFLIPVGFIVVQIIVAYWIVPVLHNIEYVSIYEYLEYRFDKTMRVIYSLGFLLLNVIMNSIYLFVPAISVTTLTGVPLWLTTIVSGFICTLYCVMGGLRGVIWTDVFQTLLIVMGLLVLIIQGFVEMGNEVWRRSFEGRAAEHFRWYEDVVSGRHSVWSILLFGLSISFVFNFGNQASAQRLLCVENKREATKTSLLSVVLLIIMQALTSITALIIFAKLTHCNPFDRPEERLFISDQVYVYGAEKILKHLPGCLGILLAGLISAAMSTVSSNINSFAAITLEDYLRWWFPKFTSTERNNLIMCQVLTAFYGALTVIIGLLVPYMGSIVNAMVMVLGAIGGPLSGILLLAFFMKRAHITACKIAILISFIFGVWFGIGSYMNFTPKLIHFVHDTSGCHLDASFGVNGTLFDSSFVNKNDTAESPSIFRLYTISSFWYSPICTALSTLLGFCLSYCFKKPAQPDPRLVSHIVLNKEEKETLKKLLQEKAERKPVEKNGRDATDTRQNGHDTMEMQKLAEFV